MPSARSLPARTGPAIALLAAALLAPASPAAAAIALEAETAGRPAIFGSGMVLQREAVVPVWGTADPSAAIRADFADPSLAPGSQVLDSQSSTAGTDGRWVVRFTSLPVGGPYELRLFEGGEAEASVVLDDVLVGDVWLLSGQSNMVLRQPRDDDASFYPEVRTIKTKHWGQVPAGAAFYFGAQLHERLGVPIGLVNHARSNTALAHWLPGEVASDTDPVAQSLFPGCGGSPLAYCLYYDEYIRPLERPGAVPREAMALRGIVWWQGEKGVDKRGTEAYAHLFPAMIRAWRANLGQPGLPVIFHQLPSGTGLRWVDRRVKRLPRRNDLRHWQPKQRIAMFRTIEMAGVSLMSSIDLRSGTHPRDFDLYGRRLGDSALGEYYVAEGQVAPYPYSGPIYESATLEPSGTGPDEVRLAFRAHTAEGLQIGPDTDPPTEVLQGFAVCCNAEGGFEFADARIENGNQVVVSHAAVATPSVVHYAIGRNARWANLFNGILRGAAPFSTELEPFPSQDGDGDGFWEPGPYSLAP